MQQNRCLPISAVGRLGLLFTVLIIFLPGTALADGCTYRKDSLGNTLYQALLNKRIFLWLSSA